MEKWVPKKPISAIYFDGKKEKYFVKRFLVENENKEEVFVNSHPKTRLEIVSTEWRPVAEISFYKERNKELRANLKVELENFINIKGIHSLGNQLSRYKVRDVSIVDALPYEEPEPKPAQDIEVNDEEVLSAENTPPTKLTDGGEGDEDIQISLF